MEVRFPRLSDGARGYCLVRRADGVVYRLEQGVVSARLPHDLAHLVVERELDERAGFWGAVADGAVFASMRHVQGRRRPHAQARSRAAIAKRGSRLTRAELLVDLVEELSQGKVRDVDEVTRAARVSLSTQCDARVDPVAVLATVSVLDEARARWAALETGQELTERWPTRHPTSGT